MGRLGVGVQLPTLYWQGGRGVGYSSRSASVPIGGRPSEWRLADSAGIEAQHVSEAVQYRTLDRGGR